MAELNWEGESPTAPTQSALQWEGEAPSALKWEGEAPTAHDWGTIDARDSAKTNVSGMGAPKRKGTWNERRKLAGEEAAAVSPLGRAAFSGLPELNLAKEQKQWLERGEYGKPGTPDHTAAQTFIKEQEGKAAKKLSNYIATRLSLREDLAEANPGFTESLVGGMQGSLLDPTNALPLPAKFLKLAAAAGGLGMATSYNQASFDRELGLLKDDPTIGELLKSGVDTAIIAAAFNILGRGIFKGKAKTPDTPKPDNAQTKAIADLEVQVAKTKADAAAKAQAEAYPELSPEFKTVDPLADQQARMVTEVGDSVVPPAEGLPHIPGEVPADPAVKIASQNYPELDVQNPVADNQYMTGKAQDIATAEQVGGVEKLDVNLNIPEGTIDNTVTPDVTRQAADLNAERPVNPIQPQLASKLQKANNIGDALAAVAPHVPDEFKPLLAALDRVSDKSIPYKVHDWAPEFRRAALEDAVGAYRTPEDANTRIEVRGASYAIDGKKPHGVDVETTLHEIAHSVTDAAFRISNSELAADPKYAPHVQYVKDMSKLGRAIEDQVQRNVNKSGKAIELKGSLNSAWKESFKTKDAAEFNSYVWSSPEFRNFLRNVELDRYGKNAWEVFKDFFKKLLGQEVRTVNALKMADSFLDRLDQIQGVTKEDLKIAIAKDLTVSGDRFMKDIAEIKDGSELMNYVRGENVGDLGYAIVKDTPGLKQLVDIVNRYFTTTNQTARIFRHPILLFVAKHIPTIQRQAEARIQRYKEDLSTVIKLPRQDQLVLFKGLVALQQPEFLAARKAAQDGGTREALLKEHGMPDHLVPEAIKVLDVMQDLYTNEQISAGRFNRGFPEAPMYFPRSHGGTFKFRIIDPSLPKDAQLIYIRGFKSPIEAQKFQTEMAARLKDNPNGWEVSPVERVDVPGYMDSLGDMMVEENLPDFLRAQVQDLNAKSMVSKRKFELERASKDIGGWIGQEVDVKNDPVIGSARIENNRLLSLLNSRIDDSYRFEVNSRIISEIIDPIMHDPNNAMQRPRLNSMLNTIVLRELGYDTSKLKSLVDHPLQNIVDDISKWINNNAASKVFNYTPSDIPLVSPHSVKKAVQNAVWLTSAWKLGWNWPVILTNSTAIPLVINDGIRTASKEGVGYHIPALAYQKMFTAPFDNEAKSFMRQAELDGMITPRAADLFTITEQHGGSLARQTADTVLNYARNQVEEWTNYTAILYYHNYYRLSQPDLKPTGEAFKTKVYQAARSHTGDYRSLATPQFISNLGLVGRGSGNFSKWVYNQTGRLLDDMVDIRENPAKFQSYMPIISNMAATVFAGGLYGMAGVADYEFLRMLGQKTGGWDWRPFSAWVEEVNKYAKSKDLPQVPDWMKRGVITEGSDQFVKAITDGQESGPDLSNTLRHAPFLQANTVMYDTFWNIVKEGLGSMGKKALELAEMGPGLSQQDEKNIAKALPTFMSPLLRDFMKEERIANGKRQFITQAGTLEEGEYAQTNFERRMDLFNLKSKKQNTTTDYKQYQLWQERTKKEKISQLIGATLNPRNLDNKALIAKNVKELVAVGGNAALDNLINQMQDRPFKRLTTYDERLVFSLIQQTDPAARQELIETIKKYQELK